MSKGWNEATALGDLWARTVSKAMEPPEWEKARELRDALAAFLRFEGAAMARFDEMIDDKRVVFSVAAADVSRGLRALAMWDTLLKAMDSDDESQIESAEARILERHGGKARDSAGGGAETTARPG